LITNEGKLHRFSHTFLGASLIAVISAITGEHISEIGLKIMAFSTIMKPK
jgi:hypothetical protein